MYWGFTGKSLGIIDKIVTFLKALRKAFYLILDFIGAALVGIGAAWLTSKGIDQYLCYWDPTYLGIKAFLKSPIFFIVLGLILYATAKYFELHDKETLLKNNNKLNTQNKTLEQQMRGITEDKEILGKKLELAYRELVVTWLSTSMQSLGILTPNMRATVYYFKDGAFHYVGRHSKNPMIAKVSTNKVILNGGVLSQAWSNGTFEDLNDCPIYNLGESEYLQYQNEKYGFDEDKVRQLTMKPCQYYAKTITDSFEPVGIIVFECNEKFLNSTRVRKIGSHCTGHESNLIGYIKKVRDQDVRVSQQPLDDVENDFLSGLEGGLN